MDPTEEQALKPVDGTELIQPLADDIKQLLIDIQIPEPRTVEETKDENVR